MATSEELGPLNSALRDLSQRVSAPPPPRQTPLAPQAQSLVTAPTRPPPPALKENPSPRPHDHPTPLEKIDPSLHCPYYDTRLGKMFANPKLYAKAFPSAREAEQFRAGKYDLSKFTPATQHPDYQPKHLLTYAQAAGSGRPTRRRKGKKATATEVAHHTGESSKPAASLPLASRRFFAIRETPQPHPQAARITKTFPDIVATTLTEYNCLLPKGFRVKVNDRGAVSLTGTDPLTPADSYAHYFDAITRRLNQSYPTGSSPGLPFSLAPTAVQLAIHSVPMDVLPDDDDQLFPFLKTSILNAKAVGISAARYLKRTELLEYPNKRLRWLSPSTPTTYKNSSHPSSSSPNGSRLRKPSMPTDTPSATTATASATPPSTASRPTPRAPFVRFTILVWHITVKTPPAQKEATPG